MAKIRSISVYKLVSNVSKYKELSCRDWSQDWTDSFPQVDTSKPDNVESVIIDYVCMIFSKSVLPREEPLKKIKNED